MSIKPITPKDIVDRQEEFIPDVVIEVFNELIALNWNDGESRFELKAVRALLEQKGSVIKPHWFNIEDIYRKAGWKVDYCRADYTETFPSYYVFSKKGSNR